MELLTQALTQDFHLWAVMGLILVAIGLYASDKFPIEMVSILVLLAIIALFQFIPLTLDNGENVKPSLFLAGLANPALIAVLALLVLGQGIVNTGSLDIITQLIFKWFGKMYWLAIIAALLGVLAISGFINNTPTVIVFIPIMLAIAKEMRMSASKVMIPLSYASMLGGSLVLVGSSTNLLVSGTLVNMGMQPLGMFDFSIPALCLAAVGFVYIIFVLPRLLPNRAPLASDVMGDNKKEFVIQLEVPLKSELIGKSVSDPELLGVDGTTFKMLQRREHAYLPPFNEELSIKPFDVLVITVTKESLLELVSRQDKSMFGRIAALDAELDNEDEEADNLSVVEVLIAPASKMVGQSIEQIGFYHNYHCTVVGIQRRSRMITARMTESRLAAGDVLMVMGTREDVEAIRDSSDMMLMEWSRRELPSRKMARRANLIFAAVIGLSASEILPVYISSLMGAVACVLAGCISPRQAVRAIDVQVILLVVAGMAMANALEVTGGASFLAKELISSMVDFHPVWIMSALFALMAVLTNVLSNNATALIFTPIAVSSAISLGMPPEMFIYAVIFAANCCSFASPIGYQTNLLVMGPGHYKFADYLKAGIPLMVIIWATYTVYAAIVYGGGIQSLYQP